MRAVCSEPEFVDEPFDFGAFVAEGFAGAMRNRPEAVELRALLRTLLETARALGPRPRSLARIESVRRQSDVELLRAARVYLARRHQTRLFVLSSTSLE